MTIGAIKVVEGEKWRRNGVELRERSRMEFIKHTGIRVLSKHLSQIKRQIVTNISINYRSAKIKCNFWTLIKINKTNTRACRPGLKKKGEAQEETIEELSDCYGKADYEQFTTTSLTIRNETWEWYKARCLEARRDTIGRKIVGETDIEWYTRDTAAEKEKHGERNRGRWSERGTGRETGGRQPQPVSTVTDQT